MSALIAITSNEKKMVVAVKGELQNPVKTWNAEYAVSQKTTIRVVERYVEDFELILTV